MDFKSYLSDTKARIDESLRQIFGEKVDACNRPFLKAYYSTLQDYISPEESEAKRIRPILVCVASIALQRTQGEVIPPDILYRTACSVELLHNASLIHDDIIDNDEFRRGQPAFHTIYSRRYAEETAGGNYVARANRENDFGRNIGILGGDQTYFIGIELLWKLPVVADIRIKLVETFQQAFDGIVEGVLVEENLANLPFVSMDDYLFMIQMKTAHLLAKSTEMGLVLAGANLEDCSAISRMMIKAGMAFQIRDDILGTFGDGAHKPADSDILEGKKTFLLTYALQEATPDQLLTLNRVAGNPNASAEEVEEVREIFRETGALSGSEAQLEQLTAESLAALAEIQPELTLFGEEFYNNFITYVSQRAF